MARRVWRKTIKSLRPAKPTDAERAVIVAACDAFIRNTLKPRFLPIIMPSEFNYPVDIFGNWRAGRYRFLQRYRSGSRQTIVEEFDRPFARIDFMAANNFDIHCMRHNDQWWPLYRGKTLDEALALLIENGVLHPL